MDCPREFSEAGSRHCCIKSPPPSSASSTASSSSFSRKLSDGSTSSLRLVNNAVSSSSSASGRTGSSNSVRHSSTSSSDSSFQCDPGERTCPPGKVTSEGGIQICDCRLRKESEKAEYLPESLSQLLRDSTLASEGCAGGGYVAHSRPETPSAAATSSPSKPVLKKATAVDLVETEVKKKMERGISHATGNETLVSAARNVVQQDFSQVVEGSNHLLSPSPTELETPIYTFTLPDLTSFTEDYRGFLEKDLIELSALISLEQSGRLNWWADTGTCQRLWPLATTGDGNCLLHAASLGMWGFHDRLLTLRKALYTFLTSSPAVETIYRRWRWQAAQQNSQSGLTLTEAEWAEEWSSVIRLASSQPRAQEGQPNRRRSRLSSVCEDSWDSPLYESLEEIHVLVLAHVLRRPIIIVADLVLKDAYGEALAPIPFGGVYLPLEFSPSECQKCPLLLTYDAGHFSALVAMQPPPHQPSPLPCVIPITDSDHLILPIQFAVDPGFEIDWARDERDLTLLNKLTLQDSDRLGLLREYLDVVEVPLPACFLDPPLINPELMSPDSIDSSQNYQEDEQDQPRSRTAKQIQSVAKQFGSIGKKLKRNLGTITRLARTGSFRGLRKDVSIVSQTTRLQSCRIVAGHQDHILAALIHTQKSLPYHQEMVTNYMREARLRFEKDKELKVLQAEERRERAQQLSLHQTQRLEELARVEGPVNCVNPDCNKLGNASTSYLCPSCYQHQISEEQRDQGPGPPTASSSSSGPEALYGSGRSRFYVNPDPASYETLQQVPTQKQPTLRNLDPTIYLANSTFFRDTNNTASHSNINPLPVNRSVSEPTASSKSSSSSSLSRLPPIAMSVSLPAAVAQQRLPPPPPPTALKPTYNSPSRNQKIEQRLDASVSSAPLLAAPKVPTRRKGVCEMPVPVNSSDVVDKAPPRPDLSGHGKVELPGLAKGGTACRTRGCSFFGAPETGFFCSKCFRESAAREVPASRV